MTLAYLDCFSGVAGDMFLGALLDAGLPAETLRADLDALGVGGWRLEVTEVERCGIGCSLATVEVTADPQPHRRLADILSIIEAADLPEAVRTTAPRVFTRLGEAEAHVHRCPVEEVHFHEVGAVDAIVDVVGTVAGLHRLGVEELVASPVNTGSGTIQAVHGTLPVPGPATMALLTGFPCYAEGPALELTTPTGAA
ncbi:MAG: LarC family nickel insertion protein, partial [Nitrospinota bacterium]